MRAIDPAVVFCFPPRILLSCWVVNDQTGSSVMARFASRVGKGDTQTQQLSILVPYLLTFVVPDRESKDMSGNLKLINRWKAAGGYFNQYTHESSTVKTTMRFTVFLPPQAETKKVPVLYYLSGLTCTDENVVQKGYLQKAAAARGVAVIAPDTSPRGARIEGEDDSWDFGTGAGFYVNATQPSWATHYRMYDYIVKELPEIVDANFPVTPEKQSIFGHSMGGHGALTIAFRNPGRFKSVSAFSPICNPTNAPWGKKAFGGYLGDNTEAWKEYDATCLLRERGPFPFRVLVDVGTDDKFLEEQLHPHALEEAAKEKGQDLSLQLQEGYDHSYFFISTFMEDHINFHADALFA